MDTTATHHRPFPSFPSTNGHHHIGDAEVSRPNGSSGSIDLTGEYDDERDGRSVHHHMITSRKAQVLPSPLTQQPRPAFVPSDSINMDPTNSPSVDGIQVNGAKLAFPSNLRSGTYTPSFRQFNSPGMAGSSSTPTVLNPPHSPYTFPNISPEQGWASSIPTAGPSLTTPHMIGTNGFGGMGNGRGISASSAIDLTNVRIPSPPPGSDKKPLCIGSIQSRAVMLYPSPAAVIGAQAPEGSKEKYQTVLFRGAELLKVRLKLRRMGGCPSKPPTEVIQVMTPGMTSYIGDLDPAVAEVLLNPIARGLLRLEGFIQRLQPEAPQFEVRVNVLLFTLPSNVAYISQTLAANNLYLLDPVPPYDPTRHSDRPEYRNAHGGHDMALRMMIMAQRGRLPGQGSEMMTLGQMDKAKQVEVQRRQVDEVFRTLADGQELEMCCPGLLIKTELFPHQSRALTFMLQREQDWSALKTARKNADKRMKKRGFSRDESIDGSVEGEVEMQKGKAKDRSRSLWEGKKDDKGRTRMWRNKITGEEIRTKKGGKPVEGKGAILADDMGLGKTLSVVSLIAATRKSSRKWAKSKMEEPEPASDGEQANANGSGIKASAMKTKVFGMPTPDSDEEEVTGKPMKRKKHDDEAEKKTTTRRSRLSIRSKATLLVCPMSTITNWEEQIREHWDGPVELVGGAAGVLPPKMWRPPKKKGEEESDEEDIFDTLRVYIYHGPARRSDPAFLATFDVVITSYNTLALEYTKQCSTGGEETPTTPGETAMNSGEEEDFGIGDTSINSRATKPEVEAEIKAVEVADALRKTKNKGKVAKRIGPEQTSPLQAVDWFRVVLDEAHYIKSAVTVASQASCELAADRRICLTGTPIQNKIEDVWALFKFLRVSPVNDKECFTKYISNPCKFGEQIGVARLQLVMRCCTLRRTKDSTAEDGRRILNLPPRKEVQLWLDLREDERKAYDDRAVAVKERVGQLQANNELSKNYANVLQEVLRLRQICDHVDLAKSGAVEEDYDGTVMDYQVAVKGIARYGLNQARAVSVVCFLKDGDGAQCVTCGYDYGEYFPSVGLGGVEEGVKVDEKGGKLKKLPHRLLLTKCLHVFCPKCYRGAVHPDMPRKMNGSAGRACSCGMALRLPADVIEVEPPDSGDGPGADAPDPPKRAARRKYVRPPGEKPNLSTKMQFLHDELLGFSKKNTNSQHYDPFALDLDDVEELDTSGRPYTTKSVVFSQWTTMLDRIGDMLEEANIKFARLDGTMTREERANAVNALNRDPKTEVLLVSTRAGGVGLNLTAASQCYLVDPYWNPSVEAQAIDRIHRMGQTRPVNAIKLMINNSIEMKLDEIQKKKANLAQLSLKNMSRKELMAQKAEELANLFR